MNQSPDQSGSKVLGCLIRVSLLGLLGFVLLGLLGPIEVLSIPAHLLVGWINFLMRVAPQISFNPDLLAMAALCLAVVLALSHWLLSWLVNHWRTDGEVNSDPNGPAPGTVIVWDLKWSAAINALVWLSFFIGMSAIGIVHQTGWILASEEPLLVQKSGGMNTLMMAWELSGIVDQALIENRDDVDAVLASDELAKFMGRSGRFTKSIRPRAYLLVDAQSRYRGLAISHSRSGTPDHQSIHVFDDRLPGESTREFTTWPDVFDEYGDELLPVPAEAPSLGRPGRRL